MVEQGFSSLLEIALVIKKASPKLLVPVAWLLQPDKAKLFLTLFNNMNKIIFEDTCVSLILSMMGPVIKVIMALWSPPASPRNLRSTWWLLRSSCRFCS